MNPGDRCSVTLRTDDLGALGPFMRAYHEYTKPAEGAPKPKAGERIACVAGLTTSPSGDLTHLTAVVLSRRDTALLARWFKRHGYRED